MKKLSIPEGAWDDAQKIYDKINADTAMKSDVENAVNTYFEQGNKFGIEAYITELSESLGRTNTQFIWYFSLSAPYL